MKGKLYQSKKQNISNNNNYKNRKNNNISPSVNVLKFNIDNNQNNNCNFNNFQNKNQPKNIRNLSQRPIRHPYNNYPNNQNNNNKMNYLNNMNYNIPQNNFMVINSNPQNQYAYNNINQNYLPKNMNINMNSNLNKNQRKFISNNKNNKAKSKEPTKIKSKINNNNYKIKQNNNQPNNDKIKIKLDQKGVYICDDDVYEEDPNDVVNNLNDALKYKDKNNLQMSQDEKTMIDTIKKVSTNRVQYRQTHQMLREIGKIMNDPVVNFLIKKEPIESKNDSPSDKLSSLLSQKILEEKKRKLLEEEKEREKNEEEQYYEELQKRIKDEMRKKKTFDFNKLSDKDRKILAQRKLYNKIGKKVYDDNLGSEDINNKDNNNNDNINKNNIESNIMDKDEINEKIHKQMKNEINREVQKENFFQEIERYNEEDDYFNIGKINNKEIGEDFNKKELGELNYEKEKEKEKPTARGILEKVLNKIEYKNQQLINHNEAIENINAKKEKNSKKKNNL